MNISKVLLLAAFGLLCVACGGDGAPAETFGLTQRVPVTGLAFPTGLPNPKELTPVRAFPNLRFQRPVYLTAPPDGSDRIFVVEQPGRIRVFRNDPAETTAGLFLDITAKVDDGSNEMGLLGFAFHPQYASNGYFYVYYTTGGPRRSVLSRYQVSGDAGVADAGSEEILLEVGQFEVNHNGGSLHFGPDGKLYLALGDGGSGNDPLNNGQDRTTLLGSILRLNDDGSIPSDNPFVGEGDGVREEIWAYGLRNVWRMSFDRATGDLWAGDVGQLRAEEIDLIKKGANYGWRVYEGGLENINLDQAPPSLFEAPVHWYGHDQGRAVVGGYVYRGSAMPSMVGTYIYADFSFSRVWALVWDGDQVVENVDVATVSQPSSFGEDESGELYVCSFDGYIYRFEETGAGSESIPSTLSQTGLFGDTAALEAAPGVIEFDVNAPLWSDGAHKRRWLALPGTSHIEFTPTGEWQFPVGTVTVKHFDLDLAGGGRQRLETRVFVHHTTGWQGYTYRWNSAQTDADLLTGAETGNYLVPDPSNPGSSVNLEWRFPSRTDCLACHTDSYGRVIGIRTLQLNRDFDFDGLVDNQLRAWNHVGMFDRNIGAASGYDAMPDPADPDAPIADRARAYLDANCAVCHLPEGPTAVNMDLRYATPIEETNTVGVTASFDAQQVRIAAGVRGSSMLWQRMVTTGPTRMPPLGTRLVDPVGRDVVGTWIDDGPQ
jgi:uncharacterized repeat protein (TIGR03806 family)